MKCVLLVNVNIPTINGILTFVSGNNCILGLAEPKKAEFLGICILMSISKGGGGGGGGVSRRPYFWTPT